MPWSPMSPVEPVGQPQKRISYGGHPVELIATDEGKEGILDKPVEDGKARRREAAARQAIPSGSDVLWIRDNSFPSQRQTLS